MATTTPRTRSPLVVVPHRISLGIHLNGRIRSGFLFVSLLFSYHLLMVLMLRLLLFYRPVMMMTHQCAHPHQFPYCEFAKFALFIIVILFG